MDLIHLPHAAVRPNPEQPRKRFDTEALEELAASIREHGLLEPIVVRPAGTTYLIVAGERRWRAAGLAGLDELPCILRDDLASDDARAFEVSMIENVVRADMDPLETARGFGRMVDAGLTPADVAARVGLGVRKVQSALSLLRLAGPIADLVAAGQLDEWTGTRLATLTHEGQYRALEVIRENGLHGQDRDRVIGQVWCLENATTLFNGAVVDEAPAAASDPAVTASIRRAADRAGQAVGTLAELLDTGTPDEATVELIEAIAKAAAKAARAARAARVARLVQGAA